MEQVQPKVFLVGETRLVTSTEIDNFDDLPEYLESIGAPEWNTDAPSDSEKLIEFMGRQCYRSFKPLLNPNVTRTRKGNKTYLSHVLDVGHGSITEHVQLNFVFHNVSRVFTHELVRHRVGVAISQESLRYVRLTDLKYWIPPVIENDPEMKRLFEDTFAYLEDVQRKISKHYNLDSTKNFSKKKKITSGFY